jgi:hypothetical protein
MPSGIYRLVEIVENVAENLDGSSTIHEPVSGNEYDMERVSNERRSEMDGGLVISRSRSSTLQEGDEVRDGGAIVLIDSLACPHLDICLLNIRVEEGVSFRVEDIRGRSTDGSKQWVQIEPSANPSLS